MSPARPCRGMRAAVAASVGLSEGPAGSARRGRLLRPPSPAPAAPGARLLRLPGSGAVRAANPERAGWTEALRAAVAELRAGAVVAVPTDTLYGLACSASCSAALGAVYRLKGRSEAKPLAVCLGRVADVYRSGYHLEWDQQRPFILGWICALFSRYCHVRVPEGLLKDLLPGPVTLVLERSKELNKDLNPFTPLVGIRIPDHAFIQDLVQVFGGPLALTSANLSSQASSLNVEEFQDLWPQLSLVIDGGPIGDGQSSEYRLGSTVVDLSVPGKFGILRPGCALESTTAILQQKYGLLPSH
ncbi:threonylcarbamoyl-AMP synthase isoform X4 [Callorhinus ursinus]|uniref:Threonylcarbamoyl-AMP synthase n=1 Tax=Callorhinus ursinus TaxID=34884 RepID=A0A3Q7MUH3_CALUR|nr:yrdC domain-containing protein, mitochondrial isoform X1 [Callorhinus ursinus]